MYTHPSATRATHQTKKHRLSDDNHLLIGTQMSSPKSKSRLELGFQQFLHLFCQLDVHRKMEKQIVQVHHKSCQSYQRWLQAPKWKEMELITTEEPSFKEFGNTIQYVVTFQKELGWTSWSKSSCQGRELSLTEWKSRTSQWSSLLD